MKTIAFLSVAALATSAAAAAAQPGPDTRAGRDADVTRQQAVERADRRFDRLDANDDGRFTREDGQQMRAERRAGRAERLFERFDLDRNGSITREEVSQAQAGHSEQHADHGGRRGMRGHRGGRRGGFAMGGHRLRDGQEAITAEQFRERALARFDRADADRDGTLTATERRAARRHRREQRHRAD